MTKPPAIPPEERALFQEAMKDVTPHKAPKRAPLPTSSPSKRTKPLPKPNKNFTTVPEPAYPPSHQWHRSGLQQRTLKGLQQGKFQIEHRCDLHGLNRHQAYERVQETLEKAIEKQQRFILFIPGIGSQTPTQRGLLSNLLRHWLQLNPKVLAYSPAQPKDGGLGALYVLLKNK